MNKIHAFAHDLFDTYDSHKFSSITTSRFNQDDLLAWLRSFDASNLYEKSTLGLSAEGRTISLYKIGSGPIRVLLWSQMHGDEPTATMALCDMFNFIANNPQHEIVRTLLDGLTLLVIPMLNPDGAERFTRRTAQLVDMNRDALALETPEARILKETRDFYQPVFGFNLHDQDPRLTVGTTKEITALALLAPAFDETRSDNPVRLRAKHIASVFAEIMGEFIPGKIAKWDDTYEPRAFGDSVQRWGTSTILIESGGWKQDPDKFFIRKLNYVGLITSLYAIATHEYEQSDIGVYEQIPFNTKFAFDYIIRNATYNPGKDTKSLRVDIGINFETSIQRPSNKIVKLARITDLGDLHNFVAFQEFDADGKALDLRYLVLDKTFPAEEIKKILRQH